MIRIANKLIAVFIIFLIITSCTNKKDNESENSKGRYTISDSLISKLTIDTVKLSQVYNEYHFIGTVTYDQDKVVKIYPLVSGLVTEVKVSLGDFVNKDQVIAIVRSGEMAGVQNDIVSAKSNLAISEKNLEATKDMYKGGIASEKDLIGAQSDYDKAKSELNRAQTVKSIYGNGKQSDYIVKSPISGYIVEKFVNPNMQIRSDNGNNLFTISDLKKVWVVAKVYESDIPKIKPNMPVRISTLAYPDKEFAGNVDKIFNVLDPDSKTMTVKIKLDNPDYILKPQMFANIIVSNSENKQALCISSKALVYDNSQYYAVVYKGQGKAEIAPVELLSLVKDKAYIKSGLKESDKVIASQALQIFSELNH